VVGEDHHLPNRRADLVFFVLFHDAFGVESVGGKFDRVLVDIGCKDLDVVAEVVLFRVFRKEDRDAVRLFSGGTPGNPHPHRLSRLFAVENFGDHVPDDRVKRVGITKKPGDTDQDLFEQC
jgi:hypothetical protein